jgi:uncharacterized protein YaiE (UPF0345 family)
MVTTTSRPPEVGTFSTPSRQSHGVANESEKKFTTSHIETQWAHNMQSLDSNGTNDWQLCACGRTFAQPSASKRKCLKTKKCLSSALDSAKEKWAGNKCRKVNTQVHEPESESANQPGLMRAPSPSIHSQDSVSTNPIISMHIIIDRKKLRYNP